MKKLFFTRIILIILICINCITIFSFSAQSGEKSSNTSSKVVKFIIENVYKNKNLTENELIIKEKKITTPIRKTAHFSIYALLGIFVFCYINTYEIKKRNKILISIYICFLYACSDELHQYFIPERSCEFKDVCIDSLGALFGMSAVNLIYVVKKQVIANN